MRKMIPILLLLLAFIFTSAEHSGAQTTAGTQVGAVAIRAFIFSVEDDRLPQVSTELKTLLSSPQGTPWSTYQAVRTRVSELVQQKLARRDWEPDPEGLVAPNNQLLLQTTSFPLPPLKQGKAKKNTPAYNINGTSLGRQLLVTPAVEPSTGRTDKLIIRYSFTSLPNRAVFVQRPTQPRPDPTPIADLIGPTTVELPASGGTLLSFKTAEHPGRTTLLVIIAQSYK